MWIIPFGVPFEISNVSPSSETDCSSVAGEVSVDDPSERGTVGFSELIAAPTKKARVE